MIRESRMAARVSQSFQQFGGGLRAGTSYVVAVWDVISFRAHITRVDVSWKARRWIHKRFVGGGGGGLGNDEPQ